MMFNGTGQPTVLGSNLPLEPVSIREQALRAANGRTRVLSPRREQSVLSPRREQSVLSPRREQSVLSPRREQSVLEDTTTVQEEEVVDTVEFGTVEEAILYLKSLYTVDLSDYELNSDYDDEGALNEDPAMFQTLLWDRADLSILDDYIRDLIIEDDAEGMLRFMMVYLDPQIPGFDIILPEVYQYIWELVLIDDAVEISNMLLSKLYVFGFSGDPAFLVAYYYAFWSNNSDLILQIALTLYPAEDFFYFCSNFLYNLTPEQANINRFYQYIEQFNDPAVYSMPNYFQSVYDMACFFRPVYPDVFDRVEELIGPFNKEQYPLSTRHLHWMSELDPYSPTDKFNTIGRIENLMY